MLRYFLPSVMDSENIFSLLVMQMNQLSEGEFFPETITFSQFCPSVIIRGCWLGSRWDWVESLGGLECSVLKFVYSESESC